ncbi:MAG: DNA recombination protein RmuC [Cytophagales bacterium]|jgi:DNA recombination protein RmuC|nr:DNA recombination protein RmuC [Cytophagales bacterium]MCA6386304.1 DNA recombination protein RmuC [Cytophagales bacterium]MCA6391501.1 DNA recombination protein RmuC [Cytophagales bacterium]MCA6399169.1 DNA recombination protein RmuC [Cytophagales bacterium]MCA6401531.1 DNA recombination protein RmuC [Cytophagales bacterium]
MEIIVGISGLVIGGLIGWLLNKSAQSSVLQDVRTRLLVEQEKSLGLASQLNEEKKVASVERNKVLELSTVFSRTDADYKNLQLKSAEQQKEMEDLQEKFTTQFENLANKIFEEKGKKFADQNKINLGEILNPLREKISDFEKKVELTNTESIKNHSALREQLTNLKELNQQITKEASNLTRALKGDSKAQGNWGEYILESILEKSGLVKGREYFIQESLTSEDGKRLQPDVVIKLPDSKNLIIDSKVSLVAYERFMSADDETERSVQLKQHILSLRQHIKGLSEKNYQTLYSAGSLDFILLFVPIEPAFSASVRYDVEIFNDAFEKNIVIVSPSTLIATLRTISSIWKQEFQNRNTVEIARQATALYEKFRGFTEDLIEMGNQLKRTQSSYEGAMNKLSTGKGNLVGSVEKIRLLGLKPTKTIDQRLVERADDNSDLVE